MPQIKIFEARQQGRGVYLTADGAELETAVNQFLETVTLIGVSTTTSSEYYIIVTITYEHTN